MLQLCFVFIVFESCLCASQLRVVCVTTELFGLTAHYFLCVLSCFLCSLLFSNGQAGKWKTILRNYPFHAKRTTVDLKDKYRNILRAREREKRQPLQQASVENRVNPQVAADNPSLVQHHQLRQQGLLQTQQHVEEKSVALATNLLPPVTVVENHSPLPPCPSMVHTVSNPSGHFLPSLSNGLSDESYCHVQRNEPTGEPRYEYHNYALIYKQPPSSQSYAPGGESQLSGSRKIPAPERMKLTTLLCDPDTEY